MPTELEDGIVALQQAEEQERKKIEAFRNGRRRALYQPRPLQEKPGGSIFSHGRRTSLQELRRQDEEGIDETLKRISRGKLEPNTEGLWLIGGSPQDADWEAIQEVEDDPTVKCNLCKSVFRNSVPGSIVLYGTGIYHFECLMSKMLADCGGDPYLAAAKYNVPLVDIYNVKESYPAAVWVALRKGSK
jgi:hypothetical protein